jgi:hypothetical protein
MILIQMPDTKYKPVLAALEIGKDYPVLGTIGNGYIIHPEGYPDQILIAQSRFK